MLSSCEAPRLDRAINITLTDSTSAYRFQLLVSIFLAAAESICCLYFLALLFRSGSRWSETDLSLFSLTSSSPLTKAAPLFQAKAPPLFVRLFLSGCYSRENRSKSNDVPGLGSLKVKAKI